MLESATVFVKCGQLIGDFGYEPLVVGVWPLCQAGLSCLRKCSTGPKVAKRVPNPTFGKSNEERQRVFQMWVVGAETRLPTM